MPIESAEPETEFNPDNKPHTYPDGAPDSPAQFTRADAETALLALDTIGNLADVILQILPFLLPKIGLCMDESPDGELTVRPINPTPNTAPPQKRR